MKIVSTRALIGRINRKLAPLRDRVCKRRSNSRWLQTAGEFYIVNGQNFIETTDVDLEEYGRELGVLGANEVAA